MDTTKLFVGIGLIAGSTIGSLIPAIWGAGIFSFSSIILGGLGAIAGIWFGWSLAKRI